MYIQTYTHIYILLLLLLLLFTYTYTQFHIELIYTILAFLPKKKIAKRTTFFMHFFLREGN